MTLQYEFDSFKEVQKAMRNLSDYHDCDKCQGKIVGIGTDNLGNSTCMYCGEIVKYPKLSKKGFEIERQNWLKENDPNREQDETDEVKDRYGKVVTGDALGNKKEIDKDYDVEDGLSEGEGQ